MKKAGFSAEKAGAVEVAAGSNGQIMPPVMGAAAFLMAEYTGIPYAQIIKHAFIPALLAYFSLFYIVHLEALKLGMEGAKRPPSALSGKIIRAALLISSSIIVICLVYYLLAWIPKAFGAYSFLAFGAFLIIGYAVLLIVSVKFPELPQGDSDLLLEYHEVTPVLMSGLYFLLPTAVLVWGLMIMEMSPGLAAYRACLLMIFIMLTQRPFAAFVKKESVSAAFKDSVARLLTSLVNGAKNMVPIGLATATAGVIVGTISLTGVGQVLANLVEVVSGGYLPAILIMTAILAIILGMGLPTTANYIIVSTLLANVIYTCSAAHGLAIPILAVHLFCLYFGVMADATPPVALAAFAASGISGGDPFRTGVQGVVYELRTAILPFVFLFNQEILLFNIQNPFHFLWVLLTSALACMAFASVTQRYMFVKTRWWEIVLLLAAVVSLFRPDILQDKVYPPYTEAPPEKVISSIEKLPPGVDMRLHLLTELETGDFKEQIVVLPSSGDDLEAKLLSAGIELSFRDDKLMIDNVAINSPLEKLGINMFDPTEVLGLELPNSRPDKWLFGVPGLFFLLVVFLTQTRRKRRKAALNKAGEASS
jgi:TRAP transporter 4TM/12TM fusion protein